MKQTRRLFAFVVAAIMAVTLAVPALATNEPAAGGDTPAATTTPTGNLTLDDMISITGLQNGDKVNFYKVLKWEDGWKRATGFTSLTDDELAAVVGTATTPGAISSTIAGKLGDLAESADVKYGELTAANNKVEQATPEAGLYIAIITPGGTGYTYNPVFVAADYYQGDTNKNTWNVDTELSYSDEAIAKKSEIDVEKTAKDATTVDTNDEETVAVGDEVTFTVKTTIPGFASNYTNPVFKVTDALSTGLELVADSETLVKPTNATGKYTVTETGKTGFTLAFAADYLTTCTTATEVEITYRAKVTSAAATNVNQEDNTITVNYSNSPTDNTGHGVLKDKTNHYTFDINGDLFGGTNYETTEVVKVGLDANGNEITKVVTVDSGQKYGALQGAIFKLYKNEDCTEEYSNDNFHNPITTDENGKLKIKGLDAGKYYLKEISAPDGYIKDPNTHTIEITTVVSEKTVTETIEDIEVTYKTDSLDSYKIIIDNVETASYTITNDAEQDMTAVTAGDTVVGTDANSGKIKNTQGVELPSTGGIGTIIFYVVGGALVVGAAVTLVVRRRTMAE